MKPLLVLTLVALTPLVPALAQATMPVPTLTASMIPPGATVNPGNIPVNPELAPIDCAQTLDRLLDDLRAGKKIAKATTTLLLARQGLAEAASRPSPGGFNPLVGHAELVGDAVGGMSRVAAPDGKTSSDIDFTISKVDGVTEIAWSMNGKSSRASVDSCANGFWTATTETSAIAIHLARSRKAAG